MTPADPANTGSAASAGWPLLAHADPEAVLAWDGDRPVRAGAFIAEARALAETLPADGEVVNLCENRLAFALGFAAALLRGLGSLFPPNARPATLAALAAPGRRCTVLCDADGVDGGGLPVLRLQRRPVTDAVGWAVPRIPGELRAATLLTSGSTGTPQPHAKHWRTLVRNIGGEAARLAETLGRPDLRGLALVATVPPQHSYGFESSVLLALLGGAAFDAGRPFYPADIVAALARVPRPRALVTTPFHLKTLLLSGLALPPVDLVLSATAPLSPQLAAQAEASTGGTLVEIYGCTEAGQVASRRTTAGEVWRTLGAMRVDRLAPGERLAGEPPPADPGDGAVADAGAGGERFVVSGGHVETPTVLADLLEPLDPQHFRLLGRANDLIHVGGKRSSLAHLNFHLNRVPGVVDGCFWLPEEDGERVARTVAFVVAPELGAAEVLEGLRPHLEPAFLPRRVVFVEALPRESTGKLPAQVLAQFAAQRLAAAAPAAPATALLREIAVPPDHPAFDGHFPGAPVLPGVVLLSEVLAAVLDEPALARALGPAPLLEQAKFLAPVGPGSRLGLRLAPAAAAATAPGAARWSFELARGETVVARGVLRAGAGG